MNDIMKSLVQIAISKAIPFCYSCYTRAPLEKCTQCGSDDLMYEMPGIGVEYGTDWLVHEIIREHLTPANTLESFEQSVTECYPETITIGWIEYETARAIRELDPVSWNLAYSEYIDSEISDGNLVTFDDGTTHYWIHDIESFIRRQ
ncbi:MAG: hypothetical protein NTV34_04805 [Proteobacteria bacterium]|nr:hypothetical protein [Pseudomonadota bacterium]